MLRKVINVIIIFFPWRLRRLILIHLYHYKIAKSAYIGIAYIYPRHLIMEDGAIIKHFNIAINLDEIILKQNALIDRSNWITGYPTGTKSKFFEDERERHSILILGEHSVITKKHYLDCTNVVNIGKYVTVAGYSSQFLTHSVNIYSNRQGSKPISIGDYCFISTRTIILGGTSLPNKSVLGAGAVLNRDYSNDSPFGLYVGVPAFRKTDIDSKALYFQRKIRDVF